MRIKIKKDNIEIEIEDKWYCPMDTDDIKGFYNFVGFCFGKSPKTHKEKVK